MNIKWMVTGFLSVLVSLSLIGMQPGSQALLTGRSDSLVEALGAAGKGAVVRFGTPFFSDREISKALREAAQRGADVVVRTSSRARAALSPLTKSGVQVKVTDPSEHAKRCLISLPPAEFLAPVISDSRKRGREKDGDEDGDDDECSKGVTAVFTGSDNCSVLSTYHKEVMVATKGDRAFFDQNLALFGTPPPKRPEKRRLVEKTPAKASVVSSTDHQMNESKGARIRTLITSLAANDSMDITSMTFDSDEIVSAIEELYAVRTADRPKIRFILDRAALKHTALLDRMQKAGGSDLSIYIYNEGAEERIWDRFPKIQHTKTITRECEGKHLTIVSTGNLTGHSDESDFNLDSYYPDDTPLFEQVREYNDALVKECTVYPPTP